MKINYLKHRACIVIKMRTHDTSNMHKKFLYALFAIFATSGILLGLIYLHGRF